MYRKLVSMGTLVFKEMGRLGWMACLFSFLGSSVVRAQNLVPNPDFEEHTHCPTSFFDLSCAPWRAYTSASPDYFHRCQTSPTVGIPHNFFGYQETEGDGYAGFYSITIPGTYEYKEYLTTPIEPMQPGFEYHVSLKVSLADSSSKGTDDIGVLFYEQGAHYIPAFESYLPRRPQVEFSHYGPLTDLDKWYLLETKFIPDSVYRHIVIGGFKGHATSPMIQQVDLGSGNLNGAYYYVDSVVVRLVHEGSLKILKTAFCAGDSFSLSFQVSGDFRTGNWFYLELSDSTGKFDHPLVLDSLQTRWDGVFQGHMPYGLPSSPRYRMRLRSSYPYNRFDPHPSPITYLGIPEFGLYTNSPVCEGDTLNLRTMIEDSVGGFQWTGPQGQSSDLSWQIPNAKGDHSGWYRLESPLCGYMDSVEVVVNPLAQIQLEDTAFIICLEDSLIVEAKLNPPSSSIQWRSGSMIWEENPLRIGGKGPDSLRYSVSAMSVAGCPSDTLTFSLVREELRASIQPISLRLLGDTSFFEAIVDPPHVHHLWTGPDGFRSEDRSPWLAGMTKAKEGWYYLQASLGDCHFTDSIYVLVSTASVVLAYPNPTKALMRIEGRLAQSGDFQYQLLDMRGRVLSSGPFSVNAYRFQFDLDLSGVGLPAGIYMLRLQVPEDPQVLRLVYLP